MIINIIVPKLSEKKYTGGILCILEYAHELQSRGHIVNIIPSLPFSDKPLWFTKPYGNFIGLSRKKIFINLLKTIGKIIISGIKLDRVTFIEKTSYFFSNLLLFIGAGFTSSNIENALMRDYLSYVMPNADHTIATIFQTAPIVKAIGKGETWYFCQHFEPYFSNESRLPAFSYVDAITSYHLGLKLIANSSWLYQKLKKETKSDVFLCTNAIDHNIFKGDVKSIEVRKKVTVISYGGRNAQWKGFFDMAKAMKISRSELPNYQINWQVYGGALLPEDNNIANYESLGFLNSDQLSDAYRKADILLSASWYESFPLFPIEAMSCGLAVITTRKGTEDYADNKKTAMVVDDRNHKSIANALIELITNDKLRHSIAINGKNKSKEFTWEKSGKKLEKILETSTET